MVAATIFSRASGINRQAIIHSFNINGSPHVETDPKQVLITRPRHIIDAMCQRSQMLRFERATQETVEHSEFQKLSAERDGALIFLLMQQTFALRRKEIINPSQPIAELKERWLALFCEVQLYKEFHRITNQNLAFSFFAWDRYTPHLLKLYKQKQPGTIRQDEKDVQATWKPVLFGLALYLKEDASDIFKSCKEADFDEDQGGAVALLAVT